MKHVCRRCGRKLDLSKFVRDRHATLGVKYICKVCYSEERKSYPSYIKANKKAGDR